MDNLPRISLIVSTRDRPEDLAELLTTVLNQSYPPCEVVVIDDSQVGSAKDVINSFSSQFKSTGCKLKCVKGSGDGLTSARNLGVNVSKGDLILFVDDDTLLDSNVLSALSAFIKDNPITMGVQPKIISSAENWRNDGMTRKLENAIHKALMLTYREKNKLGVRRSGSSVFPNHLTKVISARRLSGCCCCYKREVFNELSFDTNLKRWGYMEDLDFSYRIYKKHMQSLYAFPHATIIHKGSDKSRLHIRIRIYMTTVYSFYVFFKEVFESSILNLIAFLWSLLGNLVKTIGGLITKRKSKREWWSLIYLLGSYATTLKNLRNIFMQRLSFFNNNLQVKRSGKRNRKTF